MAGPLLNSDGSAECRAGQLVVLAAVNGPLEAKYRDERPQDACFEIVYRCARGVPMLRERLLSDKLYVALQAAVRGDMIPRSLVQVVVQVVESPAVETSPVDSMQDWGFFTELSTAINASSIALLRAGIPSKGVVSASSYAFVDSKLVPTFEVKERPRSLHAAAFVYEGEHTPRLVMCESLGLFTQKELFQVLQRVEADGREFVSSLRS